MNSTDDETAEQHNHTKKVMTEKGKSTSMDRGLNDQTRLNFFMLEVLCLFHLYVSVVLIHDR